MNKNVNIDLKTYFPDDSLNTALRMTTARMWLAVRILEKTRKFSYLQWVGLPIPTFAKSIFLCEQCSGRHEFFTFKNPGISKAAGNMYVPSPPAPLEVFLPWVIYFLIFQLDNFSNFLAALEVLVTTSACQFAAATFDYFYVCWWTHSDSSARSKSRPGCTQLNSEKWVDLKRNSTLTFTVITL